MKKIKMLLYSAAFVLALSASFAFRPSSPKAISYLPNPAPTCTATTNVCSSGLTLCIVGGQQAYTDQGVCKKMAFKP